jgi:hypothetical protein
VLVLDDAMRSAGVPSTLYAQLVGSSGGPAAAAAAVVSGAGAVASVGVGAGTGGASGGASDAGGRLQASSLLPTTSPNSAGAIRGVRAGPSPGYVTPKTVVASASVTIAAVPAVSAGAGNSGAAAQDKYSAIPTVRS